jgi:hypothetical protein
MSHYHHLANRGQALVSVGLREQRRQMHHSWSIGWIVGVLMVGMMLFTSTGVAQAATLYEYYNTGDDASLFLYGIYWKAQTFTPLAPHKITSVKLKLYKAIGSPGTVTVSIRATDVVRLMHVVIMKLALIAEVLGVAVPMTICLRNGVRHCLA